MIFYSFENLTIIAAVFLSQNLVRRFKSYFFPIEGLPFLRYLKLNDEKNPKKSTPKLQKAYVLAEEQYFTSVPHHFTFLNILYTLIAMILVYLMKWLFLAFKIILGRKFEVLEKEILGQNLVTYLTLGIIAASGILQFVLMRSHSLLKTTERRIAFLGTLIMIVPNFAFSFLATPYLQANLSQGIQKLNLALPILHSSSSSGLSWIITIKEVSLVLGVIFCFLTYLQISAILKFGKALVTLQEYSGEVDDDLERLSIDPKKNSDEIEAKKFEKKNVSKMLLIFFFSISCKIIIILYSMKPFVNNLFTSTQFHTLGLMALLALDFISGFLALKSELKTKYNTLSAALKNIEAKNDAETQFMKTRTDLIYLDSLRNALVSSYKVVVVLLILCLLTSLVQKQIVIEEHNEEFSGIFSQSTKITQNILEILKQFSGVSPLKKEMMIGHLSEGFGVHSGFDFYEELVKNRLSKRYSWVIAQGNLLALESTKVVAYYTIYLQFFGYLTYMFFLIATGNK